VIEVNDVSKGFGSTLAVDHLSFRVHPGRVTGFLGPNGAGKTTTMKLILGLATPTSGETLVNHRPHRRLHRPLFQVGALLDATAVHPGRSAFHHLQWIAQSNGIGRRRVAEVLEMVGLTEVARRPLGGFSLGRSSGWASPRPSWATRGSSCSTNRSTGWTRKGSAGFGPCCGRWPTRAAPCSSPAIC
jgi:ABC-2 type transport system ATP-binding protein